MATEQGIQALLRFLSQEAKVPIGQAMGAIKKLQLAGLATPTDIAKAGVETLEPIFGGDKKLAKRVINAAGKLSSKKRGASDQSLATSPAKKRKPWSDQPLTGAEIEQSLELPEPYLDESRLSDAVLYTNRAPLVLAFAVVLLKYTMPEQPLSSRLSLAQAVVSANSRTKAVSLGIQAGKSAEDEGWGEGQPVVKIMGREVRVMKRWGYQWEKNEAPHEEGQMRREVNQRAVAETHTASEHARPSKDPALWGLDLEALKDSNAPSKAHRAVSSTQLPVHSAQSARNYLLKSFDTPKSIEETPKSKASRSANVVAAQKEQNLGLLLGALELLFRSWADDLEPEELDRRAWNWYVAVRPEVESGVAGWGGKGNVSLSDILKLRRLNQEP